MASVATKACSDISSMIGFSSSSETDSLDFFSAEFLFGEIEPFLAAVGDFY
jgi:hypothetical protein